jgi:hypothetical protein
MKGGHTVAGQLWVRLMHKTMLVEDAVVPCPEGDWRVALAEACHRLDLSFPLIVPKHLRDWESYRQTRFLPEHFMDGLRQDRMEIEYFDPAQADSVKKSYDPRNG